MKVKLILACGVANLAIFLSTDPKTLPQYLLIVPFVLIFLIAFFVAMVFVDLFKVRRTLRKPLAFLFSATLVVLLAMMSLGQLAVRDLVIITIIFAVSFFYIYRSSVAAE